jgi:predicted nuclease with TOPRIM domain
MDQELIAYLDKNFRETARQIEGLREEMIGRFEQVGGRFERVEEAIRHNQVSLESLRGEVRLVAEGVMGLDERLGFLREEVSREVKEADSFLRLSYEDMDRHIKDMDKYVRISLLEINSRVRPLEVWRERQGRDPLELIREKFGKKPDSSS